MMARVPVQSTSDVARLQHLQRLVAVDGAGDPLDRPGGAGLDQLAQPVLDDVELDEPARPLLQERPQVGRDRTPVGEPGLRARPGRRGPRRPGRRPGPPCSSRPSRRRGTWPARPSGSGCTRSGVRRGGPPAPAPWRRAVRKSPTGPAPTMWTRPWWPQRGGLLRHVRKRNHGGHDEYPSSTPGISTCRDRAHSPNPLACGSNRVEAATPSAQQPVDHDVDPTEVGQRVHLDVEVAGLGEQVPHEVGGDDGEQPGNPGVVRRRPVVRDPQPEVGVAALVPGPGVHEGAERDALPRCPRWLRKAR